MLADETEIVVGGDTRRDQHTIAVVASVTGGVIASPTITANAAGYHAALRFAERYAPGRRVWAPEGTGSYGVGLARFLRAVHERVIAIDRPARNDQRTNAKNDQLDAVRAARTALGRSTHATPRDNPTRDALRALATTRDGAVIARTAAINQLRALVVSAPDAPRAAGFASSRP
jgi:transposase